MYSDFNLLLYHQKNKSMTNMTTQFQLSALSRRLYQFLVVIMPLSMMSCHAQTNNKMKDTLNPLLCDPAEGICEIPDSSTTTNIDTIATIKTIKLVYFTDPICSSCWGIEPQLRKLKLEYGQHIEIEYRMGGLLPDWTYNNGGISKPSDVAHHWDEVSLYYDMPIDGDVWLQDPLSSSYPPSIAFKAAQLQSEEKAVLFMRAIREMVFLKKKNIAKWEHLEQAAISVGLNAQQFKTDYEGRAKALFEADLQLSRQYGVRGFPTIFVMDSTGKREIVYGSKPYSAYEQAILKLDNKLSKTVYASDWKTLFTKYKSLTAREFSELSNMPRTEVEAYLKQLTAQKHLRQLDTKNGSIWFLESAGK